MDRNLRYLGTVNAAKFAEDLDLTWKTNDFERDGLLLDLDHLAIKTRDASDYRHYVEEIRPFAEQVIESDLDERKISVARLKEPVILNYQVDSATRKVAEARYLEVMQPRPGMEDVLVGIDHCDVLIDSFERVKAVLERKGIPLNQGKGETEYQHTLVMRFTVKGQEIKFSDRPLWEKAEGDVKNGSGTVIHSMTA